jgi:hypothetical protein
MEAEKGEKNSKKQTKQKIPKVRPEVTRAYITKKKIIFEMSNDDTITSVNT